MGQHGSKSCKLGYMWINWAICVGLGYIWMNGLGYIWTGLLHIWKRFSSRHYKWKSTPIHFSHTREETPEAPQQDHKSQSKSSHPSLKIRLEVRASTQEVHPESKRSRHLIQEEAPAHLEKRYWKINRYQRKIKSKSSAKARSTFLKFFAKKHRLIQDQA